MSEKAVMSPTNFFGYECLQPDTLHEVTVICEGSCSLMVFAQDDVAHKLDEELGGSVLRMSFKSHAQLQNSYSDVRRRASMTSRASISSRTLSLSSSQENLAQSAGKADQ